MCSKHIYMYPPVPLVSRPQHATQPQGDTYDDTILAGAPNRGGGRNPPP